jgi:predicted secreted protein
MSTSLAIAAYLITWWITLFAVLPFRLGTDDEVQDVYAKAAGAPAAPKILLKFLLTTLVSAALFAVIYTVVTYKLVSLDDFPHL